MLDPEAVELARRSIRLEIAEQNSRIASAILCIKQDMNARRTLNSSMTLQQISAVCADAAKERANFSWQILHRCLCRVGLQHDELLAVELKQVIGEFLPQELSDIKGYLREEEGRIGLLCDQLHTELEGVVEAARSHALAQAINEIDLFVLSLKHRPTNDSQKLAPSIYNFYQPVNAIQTGPSSVVTAIQNIDSQTREELTAALAEINRHLQQLDGLPVHFKSGLAETVSEAQKEIAKPQPNQAKLRTLVTNITEAIKTVSIMKPLYDLLRSTLEHWGVHLP